ncbi:hypothetical protein NMG60_11006552 [Bertholletia excelsa]
MESGGSRMKPMLLRGGKLPTDQRFRGVTDGISFPPSKRFRGEYGKFNPGYNAARRAGVAQNDLRLKLVCKELLKSVYSEAEKLNASVNNQSAERRILRRASPINIASGMMRTESLGKSHPYVADVSNPNPQIGVVKFSREISPPRYIDELQQLSSGRASNAPRTGQVLHNVLDNSRTTGPAPVPMRTIHGPEVEQTLTVSDLLQSIGLGKYAVTFQVEEVDMAALKQMEDKDLKELRIPTGPRKKILLALSPRHGRQPL